MSSTGSLKDAAPAVDDAFIGRALDEADLNALRLALYQATGDEELAQMRVQVIETHGGATHLTVLAPEHHAALRAKLLAFLRTAPRPGPVPDDAALKRMMELLLGTTLSDADFAYHRTIPAFDEFPHGASWNGSKPEIPAGFHVAIIGAGISGIVTGIQFERLGIPYTIYERRHELGGTWSINNYPDIRVDTTNYVYQYSFEKNYRWSEYFCRQTELRGYLEHIAAKYGVAPHIRYHCDAKEARFRDDHWDLRIATPQGEMQVRANIVIAASGLFGVPRRFDLPGADEFSGEIVHTANWRAEIDLRGRNVAIIGNGSTGVQLLARIAAQARQVTVFQRTPQWISPRERYGQPVSPETQWLLDTMPYFWNWNIYSMTAMGLSHQPLQEIDPQWQQAGGLINERNDKYRADLTRYIHSKLPGRPDLIAKVTPRHAPMARRLVVDNDWYTSLLRDNVELVTDGIARITPEGIRTADGRERPVDLIVAAIGFDSQKYVWPMQYFGKDGASLLDRWYAEGTPRAYLGITTPDFPNLFIHYGPNAQPRAGSLMAWQEIWAKYSAQAVADLLASGHRTMSLRKDVFEDYNTRMDAASERLVWGEPLARERNYYVDAQGRSSVNAPWRIEDYFQYFRRPILPDYDLA